MDWNGRWENSKRTMNSPAEEFNLLAKDPAVIRYFH
jgi:hypothetical protein